MKVREIALDKIFIKKNVRSETDEELGELIGSVERFTQLQPIGVYPRGERYELVWGHRRYRAAQMNGDFSIACRILDDIAERDIPIIKLQENMVRKQLSTDEILAAAAELQRQNPGLTDRALDVMLGKRPGYLSYHRGVAKTYEWLEKAGLKKEYLAALSGQELIDLKGQLSGEVKKERQRTYHRGDRIPCEGYNIVVTRGPNIIIVCANPENKQRMLRYLRRMEKAKEIVI